MVTGSCNNNSVPAVMAGGSQGVLYIAPKSFMSSKKKCSMPVANPCNRIERNTGWDRDPWIFCRTCVALTGYKLGYCFKKKPWLLLQNKEQNYAHIDESCDIERLGDLTINKTSLKSTFSPFTFLVVHLHHPWLTCNFSNFDLFRSLHKYHKY